MGYDLGKPKRIIQKRKTDKDILTAANQLPFWTLNLYCNYFENLV